MVLLKQNLRVSGFEADVLSAVFAVESSKGSLLSRPSDPDRWGFGSRPVLCEQLGIEADDSNMGRVSKSLHWLRRQGFIQTHRIIKDRKPWGATRILIALWCFLFVASPMGAPIYNSGGSGGSGFGVEDRVLHVDDPEAARRTWAEGLAELRGRLGGRYFSRKGGE